MDDNKREIPRLTPSGSDGEHFSSFKALLKEDVETIKNLIQELAFFGICPKKINNDDTVHQEDTEKNINDFDDYFTDDEV